MKRYSLLFVFLLINITYIQTSAPIWKFPPDDSSSVQKMEVTTNNQVESITSYYKGNIEAQTQCKGNSCKLIITTETATISYGLNDTYFSEIQSVFQPDTTQNRFFVCPKEENALVHVIEGSETSFTVKSIANDNKIGNYNYHLKCEHNNKYNCLAVSYIGYDYIIGLNYNETWSEKTLFYQKTNMFATCLLPSGNFFIALFVESGEWLKVSLNKFNDNGEGSQVNKVGSDHIFPNESQGKINLRGFECSGVTSAINDTHFTFLTVFYNETNSMIYRSSEDVEIKDEAILLNTNNFEFVDNIPLEIPSPIQTVNSLQFINGQEICVYQITDSNNDKYWGVIDLRHSQTLFHSNEPITEISIVDDPMKEDMNFIVTKDNTRYKVCVFGKSVDDCSLCSVLFISNSLWNICLDPVDDPSSINLINIKGNYYTCKENTSFNYNQKKCETCSGYLLIPDNLCIDESELSKYPSDTYLINSGNDQNTITNCKGLNQYYIPNVSTNCETEIIDGYYESDPTYGILSPCDNGCAKCNSLNDCTKCKDETSEANSVQYYLHESSTGGKCVVSCDDVNPDYGKDINNKKCVICSSLGNYGKFVGNDIDDDTCYNLADTEKLTDLGYIYNYPKYSDKGIYGVCNKNCIRCDENDLCLECKSDHYGALNFEVNHYCVSSCSNNDKEYYGIFESNCVNCKEIEQYRYIDDLNCFKNDDDSSSSSPSEQGFAIYDSVYNVVVKCSDNCRACSFSNENLSTPDICTECTSDYMLVNNICHTKCTDNQGIFNNNLPCVNCYETDHPYIIKGTYTCIESIESGYYESNEDKGVLLECDSSCKECNGPNNNNCISCSDNDFLLPDGTCNANGCGTSFLVKTDDGKCINCKNDNNKYKYINQNACFDLSSISSTPYFVIDDDYNVIDNCSTNCKECILDTSKLSSYESICTKCEEDMLMLYGSSLCSSTCENNNIKDSYFARENGKCIKCSDTNRFKKEDEYTCIQPPIDYKYVIIEQDYGIIQQCHNNCETCTQGSTDNNNQYCTKCINDLYLDIASSDVSYGNCVQKCPDEKGKFTENEINICISCFSKGQYKVIEEEYCRESRHGYYIENPSANNNIIKPCHNNCETCDAEGTDSDNKCETCKPNKKFEYVLSSNSNNQNCKDNCNDYEVISIIDSKEKCFNCKNNDELQYYYKGSCIKEQPSSTYFKELLYNALDDCYIGCLECSNSSWTELSHQCLSCKEGYKLSTEIENNCVLSCDNTLYKWYVKDGLLICLDDQDPSSNNKCPDDFPYLIESSNQCVDKCDDNTFLYETNKQCLSTCPSTLYTIPSLKKCVSNCKPDSKFLDVETYPHTCIDSCPTIRPNAMNETNECVDYCKKKNSFLFNKICYNRCPIDASIIYETDTECECVSSCQPFSLFNHNNRCVDECPEGTLADNDNTCIQQSNDDNAEEECAPCKERIQKIQNAIENIKDKILENINAFSQLRKANSLRLLTSQELDLTKDNENLVDVLTDSSTTITIFTNATCAYDTSLNNNIAFANISSCLEKIRTANNLPPSTEFIVAESEKKRSDETTGQITGYIVADLNGNIYSLEPCKDEKIETSSPLNPEKISNFLKAKQLMESSNIDIFNPSSDFFNDFCFPFTDENGKDVIIIDRREFFSSNSSLCEQGCTYVNIDFNSSRVTCSCGIQEEEQFNTITEKDVKESYPKGLHTNNLIVVKCYNLVFNADYLRNNIGSFVMFALIACFIITVICLFGCGFKKVYSYLNKEMTIRYEKQINDDDCLNPGNPPRKKGASKSVFYKNSNDDIYQNSDINIMKSNNRINTLNKTSHKVELPLKDNPLQYENDYNPAGTSTKFGELSSHVHMKSSMTDIAKHGTVEEVYLSHEPSIEYTNDDIDYLSYQNALLYDDRNCSTFLCRNLGKKMFFINVFTDQSPFSIIAAKFVGFLLVVSLLIALNAVFFDETYISNRFLVNEKIDVKYIIKNELPKSIYTSLIALVVSILVGFITNTRRSFDKLMKSNIKDQKDFLKETNNTMKKIKCRLIVFVVIAFLFICFFWYYVSAFCAVYKNTQGPLMIGCLISVIFLIVFQIFLSFLVMMMRYIGLKCKCECLYNMSLWLY